MNDDETTKQTPCSVGLQPVDRYTARTRTRTEANRENAQRSTGPKNTTSTRFNAVKHGLLAEGITELDSPESFPDFCARLEAELKPIGAIETFLVRRIALEMVRSSRCALLEAEFITGHLNPAATETRPSEMDLLLPRSQVEVRVLDPGLPARFPDGAVCTLADGFGRYQTQIENRLYRSLNELERRQRQRRGEHVPPPAGTDDAICGDAAVRADGQQVASFGKPP